MSDTSAESIETKIAYLEKTVSDLDGLVYEYGRRTERLEEAMRAMARRISEMGSDKGPGMPAGERPPHY
ncbi:MAG: hypothetical protein CVV47_06310 [Spirochaetae bacterium HGW-Spirochaetae-3]|jgi:uncharacterized coiled-coil protein SlyX|nr:MAG: hypothetical protein CVV47_06310 [Spirochaetae bacterium HGW-Spirochaetae-3]